MQIKQLVLGGLLWLTSLTNGLAQNSTVDSPDVAYKRVATERASKIVATLGLTDSEKTTRVQEAIAQQYQHLNTIHEGRKTALTASTETEKKAAIEAEVDQRVKQLHQDYLATLGRDLTPSQIEQVKDGMTYGVLPITFKGYQQMLPDLTTDQKNQILNWLTEARERAMDAGTSKEKHAMFGKYKGRINNYLSAAGIDMKKASKEWEERIAREKETEKNKKS